MLFIPTFFFSQFIPNIFFKALEFVGGIAAMIIFGIILSILGWNNRFKIKDPSFKTIVPGRKLMLIFVFSFALFVILYEIYKILFA